MSLFPLVGNRRPVDPILTKVVAGYANDPRNFIQDLIVPTLFNGSRMAEGTERFMSGTIQRMAANAYFGDATRVRAVAELEDYPRARGADFDPLTFRCKKYGGEVEVSLDSRYDTQAGGYSNSLIQLAAEMQTQRILREQAYATLYQTVANFTTQIAPGALAGWNQAGGDPNGDIVDAIDGVSGFGVEANTIILPRSAYNALRTNNNFLEFQDTRIDRTVMNRNLMSNVLASRYGLTNVFYGMARHNTDKDPDDAPTLADIWTDTVWIGYLPINENGVMQGNLGAGVMGSNGFEVTPLTQMATGRVIAEDWNVTNYEEESKDALIHKIRYFEDIFVVGAGFGATIADVVK